MSPWLFTTFRDFRQHFSQESIVEVHFIPQSLLPIKSINHSIQSNDTVGGFIYLCFVNWFAGISASDSNATTSMSAFLHWVFDAG